jgi:hypothetical protein
MRPCHLALAALTLSACAGDLTVGEETQAVEGGEQATQFDRNRAALLTFCTATRISEQFIITALHCSPVQHEMVQFCTTANTPTPTPGFTRGVDTVANPPGTSAADDDWEDDDGKFADIAVVKLTSPVLTTVPYATMAWTYPGDGAAGHKVGAGRHYEDPELFGVLLRKDDETWTEDDGDGIFRTTEFGLNHGDSGGPFYYGSKLLGVVNGSAGTLPLRARYTSIPEHLDWILHAIHYDWPGGPLIARYHGGTAIETFFGSSTLRCAYACDRTSSCISFNRSTSGICQLMSAVTSSVASSVWATAIK